MSMDSVFVLQMLKMFVAYSVIAIVVPHFVVGKAIRFKNASERFVMYTLLSNFYVINLVYLLELLHISHKITLILFTVVPLLYIKVKLDRIPVRSIIAREWELIRRLVGGQQKLKAYRALGYEERKRKRKIRNKKFAKSVFLHIPDILIVLLLLGYLCYLYGSNNLVYYGYKASDCLVHNNWINKLSENVIFAKGIYPYGFHNVIYYMHEIFGFDTYMIFNVFNIVITVWVDMTLLAFLKLVCKTKYIPYMGAALYAVADVFNYYTYWRFSAVLPQEYGMIFILPTIYAGFAYFREQRREIRGSAAKGSRLYLAAFAMSFSMTLTVHFYGTMAVGICIAAMAIAYSFWLFRKPYFKKVFATFFISLFIAILPMGIAYAAGTDLEGSLRWGLSIIFGAPEGDEETQSGDSQGTDGTVGGDGSLDNQGTGIKDPRSGFNISRKEAVEQYGEFKGTVYAIYKSIEGNIDYVIISGNDQIDNDIWVQIATISTFLLIVLGLILLIPKNIERMYGASLLCMGLNMLFMAVIINSDFYKLPSIMQQDRAGQYYTYYLAAAIPLCFDAVVCFISCFARRNKVIGVITQTVSFCVIAMYLVYLIPGENVRKPLEASTFQKNASVLCLYKIIEESEDNQWTLCSANEEGRMLYGHGFHYELIDFLSKMEYCGPRGTVRVPTPVVYFYVEKIPYDYTATWEGSGTLIGDEFASKELPEGRNLGIYIGENRWICMSRLYFWAQKFKELYPNETSIFYETDDFVCYRVEQNPYRLFNFAIDYKYNLLHNINSEGPK
ncbi:MAG: hypothetical protein MJ107_01720 [Lachnospiraceae bacterium]|nr:hypothetical protein [Lachnospiraceae bacterium]